MAFSTTRITGRVPLPDGQIAVASEVTFTLTGWDRQDENIVAPAEVRVNLDDEGYLPANFSIWRTSAGDRGVTYAVTVRWTEKSRCGVIAKEAEIGRIYLTVAGPVTLASLLAIPAPLPNVPDALAQAIGAATAAIEASETAEDEAEAAEAARVAAAAAATAAAASATVATGTPQYASLAAAQSATVPAYAVSIIVAGELFVKDPSGNDLTTSGAVKWRKKEKPLVILCLGQSNMRGNSGATGGDQSAPSAAYVWNNFIPTAGTSGSMTIGSAWVPAAVGQYPADLSGANSLPFAIMRVLRDRTNRPIFCLTVARGGYSIEALLKPETRDANSWPLPSSNVDLSGQIYPQAANALAAVPGNHSKFDYVFVHQGEYNMNIGDTVPTYRAKLAALSDDLLAAGLIARETDMSFGGISSQHSRWIDHAGAITNQLQGAASGVKYAPPKLVGLAADDIHFNGLGIDLMGRRLVDAAMSPLDKNSISETGSFTPTLTDGSGIQATGAFTGTWRRDGRMVYLQINLQNIVTTGMAAGDAINIGGAPWPCAGTSQGDVYTARATLSGSPVSVMEGGSNIRVAVSPSGGAGAYLTVGDLTSGSARIRLNIWYPTLH